MLPLPTQPPGAVSTGARPTRKFWRAGARPAAATGDVEYEQIHWFPFAVFLGYVAFFYLQGGYRFPLLGSIRFELIVGTVLTAYALLRITQRRHSSSTGVPQWIVAILLVALLMTALSVSPAVSWNLFVGRILKFLAMCVFINAFVVNPRRLRAFLFVYLLAFLKMAQEGIGGLITGSLVWENQGTPRLHGPTPNYLHPNSFSGTQLGTIPFLLSLRQSVPRVILYVMLAQAAAAATIVVTTGSRTGYVALIFAIGVVVLRSASKFRAILLCTLGAMILLPFIPSEYTDRFDTILTQRDEEGASIEMRKEIFDDAWQIWTEHPLGVGVGAFTLVRNAQFGRNQATHNLYMEVAADMGIQGLIVFLGLVVCMLRLALRLAAECGRQTGQLSNRQPAEDTGEIAAHLSDLRLLRATAQAVFYFLIIRLALGIFGHDFYEIYWWFAAGLLLAVSNMMRTATARTRYFAAQHGGPQRPADAGRNKSPLEPEPVT